MVKIVLDKGGAFTNPGETLDVDRGAAERLIREKRAHLLVPEAGRTEKMVPSVNRAQRMTKRG